MIRHSHISIIIPLLDEEESLQPLHEWLVRVLNKHNLDYEIIFIDDGSKDDSWNRLLTISQSDPNVKAIRFFRNYGKSAALNVGFEHCTGDVVITMDADLQDSPEEVPELVAMIREQKFDLVSGWKKVRHDPKLAKNIPSKIYNWAARKISKIQLHDFNCGLKAYHADVVKNIEVYGEMHRYIPVLAKNAGFDNIGEKVVVHQARQYGKTKFGVERFINGFLDLLSISFIGRFGKRPMHFFGTVGFLSSFIGFIILSYLAIVKLFFNTTNIDDRPLFFLGILLVIVGVQLFIAGFLAELIIRSSADRNNYQLKEKLNF